MNSLATAAKLFAIFFILTGLIYPLTIMVIATTAFPYQAHGSLIVEPDGTMVGSALIGQNFSLPRYFQGRPSATSDAPYNAASSGGSNLGPTNPLLLSEVAERIMTLRDLGISGPIPSDLVTTSASGLDPHLSLDAALLQVPLVARERNVSEADVRNLVFSQAVDQLPFAQPYVNILSLNRALDERFGGVV
jgi:K+-transporting ATPase ATPase C chain